MVMEPATAGNGTADTDFAPGFALLLETPAAIIELEFSSRNARVAALQTLGPAARRPRNGARDERGADMADVPGGSSGILCRDYKGKEADRLVTRIDPGVVSLAAELRGHERQAAEELEQWKSKASASTDPLRLGKNRKTNVRAHEHRLNEPTKRGKSIVIPSPCCGVTAIPAITEYGMRLVPR
jgi:hypothetical protein